MSGRLSSELKQIKPFPTLTAEAILNVQRTADQFTRALTEAMKPAELSPTQYNALRILQGSGKEGRTCSEIAERMVTHDPDITRLIDRLQKRRLVLRVRSEEDRRVVRVRITQEGSQALTDLAPVLAGLERKLLGHLENKRLKLLIELLEEARGG